MAARPAAPAMHQAATADHLVAELLQAATAARPAARLAAARLAAAARRVTAEAEPERAAVRPQAAPMPAEHPPAVAQPGPAAPAPDRGPAATAPARPVATRADQLRARAPAARLRAPDLRARAEPARRTAAALRTRPPRPATTVRRRQWLQPLPAPAAAAAPPATTSAPAPRPGNLVRGLTPRFGSGRSERVALPARLRPESTSKVATRRSVQMTIQGAFGMLSPAQQRSPVGACRNAVATAAVPLGAQRIRVDLAGPMRRGGATVTAPVLVSIKYPREVRQARVNCRLDSAGTVIGLR